ncbi:MAG: type II secretion system F family protein [Spirochaetes bacterium]|nr:type II secretion system F family protein [Spirochaetota bacterium]
MIFLIVLLFGFAVFVFIYNIIPEKGREFILLKRLKKKELKVASKKRKSPVKEYILNFVHFLEVKTKKWDNKYINNYKESLAPKIQKAGLIKKLTPDRLFAIQIASMLGAIVFYLLVIVLDVGVEFNIVYGLLVLVIGFMFPTLVWLKGEIDKRTKAILRSLPDTIDLLTLCVEAGLDFGSAIRKIVEKGKKGPLRDEFAEFEKEISMGSSRVNGLRNMSKRNDIDDLNSCLVALIQAVKMGTSLAPILRTQAEQLRIRRSQRAEKLAAEAPVKMLAPLIICIFPTVFIILFVPIVMQLLKVK